MYRNSKIAKAVKLAMFIGAGTIAAPAFSADDAAEESIERIQITGSAIKRTDMEGALPVTTLTKEDIIKTGVTNTADLIAQIPSMQGFTTAGESVGGGGGGIQTASLRDLGGQYTLVLLNGRRMASADSGGTIDLNSIPLAAIERVEVLTDGASALYGSDAIAGVVNFILKSDLQEFNVSARMDVPHEDGGDSHSYSFSGGYGDLSTDGFNIMASYSHDSQDQLKSVDRDFAKTGFLPFMWDGEEYVSISGSSNAIPGNAYLTFADGTSRSINPYRLSNGECHNQSAPSTSSETCVFDYTSTLEIAPKSERDNLFAQAIVALGDDHELYGTASWSDFSMVTRIAPYPTGTFALDPTSQIVVDNIYPHLSAAEIAGLDKVSARWRTLPGGNRTDDWNTETTHFVLGLRGDINDISYDVAITQADANREQNRVTGYPIEDDFMALVTSGAVNIFDDPANLTPEQNQMVKDTMFSGLWDETDTSMFSIEAQMSTIVAELPAGDMYFAAGFDYREHEYGRSNGPGNDAEIVLFESATPEFGLSRETYGLFVEFAIPIAENFEITTALRYDNIGEITDSKFKDNRDDNTNKDYYSKVVSNEQDDVTYKISASYRPTDEWLVRASYGTGFKAPSMREIAEPRIEFGVTSVAYDCPFPSGDSLGQYCYDDKLQYDVYREGNADLSPETSEQLSFGFVYAPDNTFSFGMDYWSVDLEDQVARLTQDQIFTNADIYRDYYTTREDPGTGDTVLAIIQPAVNIGQSNNSGLDWHIDQLNEFSFGTLNTRLAGTYMIESENLRVGTDNVWDTSMGKVGPNGAVTFRNIINLTSTLSIGDLSLTGVLKYRSGYDDIPQTDCAVLTADWSACGPDVQLAIPSYTLINLYASYPVMDGLNLSVGINNAFDKQPPLTLNGDAGHQVGYDPRYADPYGRTFYLTADYTF